MRKTDETISDINHGRRATVGGSDICASELEGTETALPNSEPSSATSANIRAKRHGEEIAWHVLKRQKITGSEFLNSAEGCEMIRLASQENVIFAAPSAAGKGTGLYSFSTYSSQLVVALEILVEYISSIFENGRVTKDTKYPVVILDAPTSLESSLQRVITGIDIVDCRASGSKINKCKNKIVLMESSALLDNLVQGSIKLKRVGALILSDCPAYDDEMHPIIRMFRNFYTILSTSCRPLVFAGLFAPTDFLTDLKIDFVVLEAALHSKIYGLTADARARCLAKPYPVKETVVHYDPFPYPLETKLVRRLRELDSNAVIAQRLFDIHHYTLLELGPWAADLVWRRSINELPSAYHQILRDWAFGGPNFDINSSGFNLTPKAVKLIQILESCHEFGNDFRGVIFVHRRVVAYMMEQLLVSLTAQFGFLRIQVAVGARDLDTSAQDKTLRSFKDGSCNLLIVTKSLEDLDLPIASVIIKYNLYNSHLSHARALSHTLKDDGHIISMVERHDSSQFGVISRLSNAPPSLRAWTNTIGWTSQSFIAPETLCYSEDAYNSDSEEEEPDSSFITDPTTGCKMSPQNSVDCLHWLSGKGNREFIYQPLFEYDVQADGRFVCRATLSQTQMNWSAPRQTRAGARRLASHLACVELFQRGLLDSRAFPKPRINHHPLRSLPPADAHLSGTRTYEKKSPAFWANSTLHSFTRLYPMIISIESSPSVPRHAHLVLLTRQPLPDIPSFRVFFASLPSGVRLTRAEPFSLDERQLQQIYTYTIQLWRGILNKSYTATLEECLVLCAPIHASWFENAERKLDLPDAYNHIVWDSISALVEGWIVPLDNQNADSLRNDVKDAIVQDRWTQFTRRYDNIEVRSDLSPLSKPLDPELKDFENLVEVSKARRKDFQGLKDYTQPLIEVSTFPSFVDRLNPAAGPYTASRSTRRYFVPELCAKVTIPASTFRTALLLPCIMRRLDDFLLVKELNACLFNQRISEDLLHAAVSTPSAGIEYDYERLELLGDTFLKQISSVYVFVMYPKADEGSMHNYRQSIINNKFLLKKAVIIGLPAFIQSRPFSLKTWKPSAYPLTVRSDSNTSSQSLGFERSTTADSILSEAPNGIGEQKFKRSSREDQSHFHTTQRLGDKAHVAEAIIGAALLSGGVDIALKVVKALCIPLPGIETWSDFSRGPKVVVGVPSDLPAAQISRNTLEAVEAITGYHFQRPDLLIQALTHFSKTSIQSTTYERLEFIGDAVLDFMVVQHIFSRYNQMSPGGLTLLKGAMVSNATLAAACVWSGLHHHLRFESTTLAHDIHEYASLLERAQAEEYGSAEREGRIIGQYWYNIESPKVLSDVVESILGAIFVSDRYSPVGAEIFFNKVLKPFYGRHVSLQTLSHHPTKILSELFQSRGCSRYSVIKEQNEYLVLVHNVILASSRDEHGISGARVASCIALDALEGDPGFLSRTCDCRERSK
ncbi:hypothetical protein D9757_000107 [Collybiopsis confluens]|uniref:RNase III domain-containing protein n=1 Tax=Collybiopsis confluens TaxID=2823264 RepID=A0A8H5I397_9AGAR|nr:hypothetical protein D9757_000107 [Collybiopsis confluens]